LKRGYPASRARLAATSTQSGPRVSPPPRQVSRSECAGLQMRHYLVLHGNSEISARRVHRSNSGEFLCNEMTLRLKYCTILPAFI
jgi:hypothetical protein